MTMEFQLATFYGHKTSNFSLLSSLLHAHFLDSVYITTFGNIYMVTFIMPLLSRLVVNCRSCFPPLVTSLQSHCPTTLFIATWEGVADYGGGFTYMTVTIYHTINEKHKHHMVICCNNNLESVCLQ